jgi:hypothetical protein
VTDAPLVIELGVMERDVEYEPEEGPPRRPEPFMMLLLLVGICVIMLGSATAPPVPPQLMLSVPRVGEAPRIAGEQIIAQVDRDDGIAITSYGAVDGAVHWEYKPAARSAIFPVGPMVLLSPQACRGMQTFRTEGIDAATGVGRWTLPGAPVWQVAGSDLVVFKRPVNGCTEATVGFDPIPNAEFVWSGVDAVNGTTAWAITVPDGATLSAGIDPAGRASWLAVNIDGTVRAYDLRTGAETGTLALGDDPRRSPFVRVFAAGNKLLVAERNGSRLSFRGYSAPALTLDWESVVPPPPKFLRLELDSFISRRCGPVICVGPPGMTIGIDPASGEERWRVSGRSWRIGPNYGLFVVSAADDAPPVLRVHNLTTGAVKLELPASELVGRMGAEILLRTASSRGGRLWRLDLSTGVLRPVVALPGWYSECDIGGRILICRTASSDLEVWRLPADAKERTG